MLQPPANTWLTCFAATAPRRQAENLSLASSVIVLLSLLFTHQLGNFPANILLSHVGFTFKKTKTNTKDNLYSNENREENQNKNIPKINTLIVQTRTCVLGFHLFQLCLCLFNTFSDLVTLQAQSNTNVEIKEGAKGMQELQQFENDQISRCKC